MRDVLELIKSEGPISAEQIALRLGLSEKQARSGIDRLRALGETIWHDPTRGAFWWRNDQPPGSVPHGRWKRVWPD